MVYIGDDVNFDGAVWHVQDVDRINLAVRIGQPDAHGICWECKCVGEGEVSRRS